MPVHFVIRTSRDIPMRGGARVSGFDHEEFKRSASPHDYGEVTEEQQWDNLKYFLERVAESADVKLAMHPDDPPLSPIQGIARIIISVDNYQKMVDLVPGDVHGIGLCQGNFGLMTDDLPGVIRHFGEQKKIHFVHFRDIRAPPRSFMRPSTTTARLTWPPACVPTATSATRAWLARITFSIERLFAIGYMKGLIDAVYSERR